MLSMSRSASCHDSICHRVNAAMETKIAPKIIEMEIGIVLFLYFSLADWKSSTSLVGGFFSPRTALAMAAEYRQAWLIISLKSVLGLTFLMAVSYTHLTLPTNREV